MNIEALSIPVVKLLSPKKFADNRGFFMETFRQDIFNEAIGETVEFVQDNHSFSKTIYTVRGLHYQSHPHAQGKLVRCTKGHVLDVAVDARPDSSTYGHHVKAILSAENARQLYIPAGFLHGFATLEPNTEVQYKCTDYYAPDCDGSVLWNDPDLAIDWGFPFEKAILSDKDRNTKRFALL